MERSAIRGSLLVKPSRIALRSIRATVESYAASMRRKPFHMAVAVPEVSTGRMRVSW